MGGQGTMSRRQKGSLIQDRTGKRRQSPAGGFMTAGLRNFPLQSSYWNNPKNMLL
jgi:hypothetical protein